MALTLKMTKETTIKIGDDVTLRFGSYKKKHAKHYVERIHIDAPKDMFIQRLDNKEDTNGNR